MSYQRELRPIVRLPSSATSEEMKEFVQRDGGVIVERLISPRLIEQLLSELECYTGAREAGTGYADAAAMETLGTKTRRITGLAARSRAAEEIIINSKLIGWAEGILSGKDYGTIQLSTSTYAEIFPGEKPQPIHADEGDYPSFLWGPNMPQITCNAIVAIDEFTAENGGTRVIPGSHVDGVDPNYFETQPASVAAEMPAGSVLLTNGKVLHGGGANISDKSRRALLIQYCAGWLRPLAAHNLETSLDRARELTPKMQELLGYKSFYRPLSEGKQPRALLQLFDMGEASNFLNSGPLA